MPQTNDIMRTTFCIEQWGRMVSMHLWWKLDVWDGGFPVDGWLFQNALQWLAAVDPWIDQGYRIQSVRGTNLTTPEPHHFFYGLVTGVPKPEDPVDVVQKTAWVHRYGIDAAGNALRSSFPISNIQPNQNFGRMTDAQLPSLIEHLTHFHTIISPVLIRWTPGFMSRKTGEFVANEKIWVNPQLRSLKTRTRRGSTWMQSKEEIDAM